MAASHALNRFRLTVAVAVAVTLTWVAAMLVSAGEVTLHVSNAGLTVVAFAAAAAGIARGIRQGGPLSRFWILLGGYALMWGLGQTAWSYYESIVAREEMFPTIADIGYLGAVPLAVLALVAVPTAAPTLAGRVRTVLDGLIVAASVLMVSYLLVLSPVVANSDSRLEMLVSLAYPLGDVVVITMIIYTMARARLAGVQLPISLSLVGLGLLSICVADSGFAYLEAVGGYGSGSLIDGGWFAGFVILFLAARLPVGAHAEDFTSNAAPRRPIGLVLPYVAVTGAVVVSVAELLVKEDISTFAAWSRLAILVFLVLRQLLTLMENHALTRDLEDRVEARTAELAASQQRFAALVQHSSDVVTIVDPHGVVQYQSSSSQRVFGYAAEQLIGRSIAELVEGHEEQGAFLAALRECARTPYAVLTPQTYWRDARGSVRHVEVTVTNLLSDPAVAGLVLNSRDITDRKMLEDQLVHQAFHDSLTTLANRALFKERIERAVAREAAGPGSVGVLFLDLDGFKEINDNLGHSTGDVFLTHIADRLRAAVRPGDVVARLGGDEFAILVEGIAGEHVLRDLADRVIQHLQRPLVLGGQEVHPRGSIGIATRTSDLEDAEQLLRNADLAMYRAKAAGGGGFAQYAPAMHADLVERFRMESELRRALDLGQLELHYQPMIDLGDGHVTGVEALVRWRHPQRGVVSPDQFIPLAEATGLIHPLGDWILREACRQTAAWQRSAADLRGLQINVNMSPTQLLQVDLPQRVAQVLRETGLAPRSLVLEMTESVLMDHSDETLTSLQALKELGVQLAIDDFGTGYSSLSYLHRFPVDVLKIDRSFIERMGGEADLVSTIVQLGHAMHLETVAEGIEEQDQYTALRQLGCTTGQGFHISRPLPGQAMSTLLAGWDPVQQGRHPMDERVAIMVA